MKPYTDILTGQVPEIAMYISERTKAPIDLEQRYNTIAFYDSRGLKVAFLYNGYTGRDIAIHVAARPGSLWCHPDILFHIFNYPFNQLNCQRLTAPVWDSNIPCRRVVEALGFVQEGRLRRATRDKGDAIIYGMLPEECHWLGEKDVLAKLAA